MVEVFLYFHYKCMKSYEKPYYSLLCLGSFGKKRYFRPNIFKEPINSRCSVFRPTKASLTYEDMAHHW